MSMLPDTNCDLHNLTILVLLKCFGFVPNKYALHEVAHGIIWVRQQTHLRQMLHKLGLCDADANEL